MQTSYESNNSKHVKKSDSILQCCTYPSQPTPFHVLISDAVEVCGGPHKPLQILNRLGCRSSPDAHDRFAC